MAGCLKAVSYNLSPDQLVYFQLRNKHLTLKPVFSVIFLISKQKLELNEESYTVSQSFTSTVVPSLSHSPLLFTNDPMKRY